MFFPLAKLFWFFCAPSHLVAWLSVAAAILLAVGRDRWGRYLAYAAAGMFLAIGFLPVSLWLMQPLENRYPHPAWPAHVDGILVLGGGLDTQTLLSRGAIGTFNAEARLVTTFELARRYPNARVIFSGGTASAGGGPEAVAAKYVFAQMGLPPDRLLLEDRSRDSWENFVFSKRLAKPKPGDVWVLATSAFHLPRAMQIAARVGWQMIPWATDYTTDGHGHYSCGDFSGNLLRTDLAAKEWIGLLAYRLSGRTAPAGR